MNCPKCGAVMEQVIFEDIQVDRCTRCKGLWFDEFEKDDLQRLEGAEAIDIGDPRTGRQYNKSDSYPCPKCKGVMIRMVDPRQSHIWFEQCGSCRGTFFDAGEFRDLKEHTLSDLLKSWFTRERP